MILETKILQTKSSGFGKESLELKLSLEDNFFSIGGTSLLATSLITQIQSHFGVEIELKDLLENPSIEAAVHLVLDKLLLGLDSTELEALIGRTYPKSPRGCSV